MAKKGKAKKEKPLSERQQNILKYIFEYGEDVGRPPTIREIGHAVNISSTSVVNYNLTKLAEKGLIDREADVSRGLRLTDKTMAMFNTAKEKVVGKVEAVTEAIEGAVSSLIHIPIAGDIVASEPLEMGATDHFYEDLEISASLLPDRVKTEELFALRVNGDSMIDAMVNHGDLVIMRQANQARNGDMVAVWLTPDDTTTLKYFYHEGDSIRLQPANPTMDPIRVPPENVQIQGKVVMVVRQLGA